ncbi:MAG: tetratricopeptide repeat protein [Porphyromonadaceae bacterium]|nr:tetratricopeptide repeat protein [Porphyromonadaceae bacterium]
MNKLFSLLIAMIISMTVFSQNLSLKEQALEQFKAEHYNDAINLLEQALKQSPDDAEIYFHLGCFNHYNAYDSRPLKGYDFVFTERIFEYLDKAIELNPNYGDAKYFYSAECGSLAMNEMQNYDAEKVKYYYELAFKKGTFPKWLIEYGRNMLSGCGENAILFTGGDADFNICSYLQICKNFRTDVTVIPIGLTDRPWYVSLLKKGLENTVRRINIDLTEEQIMDIRPFKWRETNIFIDISPADRLKFDLAEDYKMKWAVVPDLQSYRMHSKIEGEEPTRRTLLSPQRAILLQIVEDNFSERPIYFSIGADPSFLGGLEVYFQNCGLVNRLTPITTADTQYQIDVAKLEKLFKAKNLTNYKNVKENNFPRISGTVVYGYPSILLKLANYYRFSGKENALKQLTELYKNQLKIGFNEEYEEYVTKELEK